MRLCVDVCFSMCVCVCVRSCTNMFCCRKRETERESSCFNAESLSETGSSMDKIASSSRCFARRRGAENQITLFSLTRVQDQSKDTVKDGLPNVLILCLLSFITDEMNASPPAPLLLATPHSLLFSGLLGTSITL